MLTKLKVKGLKSLKDISINCTNLNIFVGTNSSGKSSILQSLLLISQNISNKTGLNGELLSLGEFRKVKCVYSSDKEINITVEDTDGMLDMVFTDDIDAVNIRKSSINDKLVEKMDYRKQKFNYLSCSRIGSKDTYEKNFTKTFKIGINGEYAIDYLLNHGSDLLDDDLRRGYDSFTLLGQVNYWLKYIVDTIISPEDIPGTKQVKAKYYSKDDAIEVSPINIGSGVSYIVSIIIMCLAAGKDDIMIVENPEIHLHPLSQSRLCEFLYFIANTGRQIFVESHSDHIFNGIRAGIATKNMDENNVNVYFTSLDEDGCTIATDIKFGNRGRILNPLSDLFEQFDIDMNKMLGF